MAASPISLLVLLLGVLVVVLVVRRTGVDDRDVAWIAGSTDVRPDEARVYRRYLERHRRHRLAGGTLGVLLAVVVGVRNYGEIQLIGAGSVSPFADVFFCAVAGILVGALSAETYRLAQPRGTVATASLVPREAVALGGVVTAARVLVGLGLVWGAVSFALAGEPSALGVGVFGVVLAALAESTRAAVTGRRRPVRSLRAVHVDGQIRRFAGRSVSWLQLSAASLTAAWVLSLTPVAEESGLAWILVLPVLAGLVAAVVLLRRAAPRPHRRSRPSPEPVPR